MGGLELKRTFGAEAVGRGHILAGEGRRLDASFALLEPDFAYLKRDVNLASLGAIGCRAILSARDDVQRAGERLFGERAEIPLELQGGASVAQAEFDVARTQDAAAVLQFGLVEADDRGFLADHEVEARRQVAILDPQLAGPDDAGTRERERRAFRAHEEPFATEAGDKVGTLKVAGQFEAGDDCREGFERQVACGSFHEHASGLGTVERERLAELEGKEVQPLAEDARVRGTDDGRFAGGALYGGLGAHADALELIDR